MTDDVVTQFLNGQEDVSWTCHLCKTVYSPNVVSCPKCSANESTEDKPKLLTEG